MILKINDVEYKVWWNHGLKHAFSHKRTSICYIALFRKTTPEYDDLKVITSGEYTKSARDTFCRSTGRKLSFARMIKKFVNIGTPVHIEKEGRRELWKQYFKQFPIKKINPEIAFKKLAQIIPGSILNDYHISRLRASYYAGFNKALEKKGSP